MTQDCLQQWCRKALGGGSRWIVSQTQAHSVPWWLRKQMQSFNIQPGKYKARRREGSCYFFHHKRWGFSSSEFVSIICAIKRVLTNSAPLATAEFVYHIAVDKASLQDTLCMLWPELHSGLQSFRQLHSRAHCARLALAPLNGYLDFFLAISSLLLNPFKNLAAV